MTITLLGQGAEAQRGIALQVPTNPHVGALTNITWTYTANAPPTFGVFLLNATNLPFGLKGVLGMDFKTSDGSAVVQLPSGIPAVYVNFLSCFAQFRPPYPSSLFFRKNGNILTFLDKTNRHLPHYRENGYVMRAINQT